MVRLLCYEPAGQVLTLSGDDLTRHVLGLGATGCGKTTGLINPFLKQLINTNANDPARKPGMLILDPKADDTQDKVRAYARAAGRSHDVLTLSDTGECHYGFFAGFQRLDQVDEFTRRVLYGTRPMGEDNAYWTESRFGLINAALTILLATDSPVSFDRAAEYLRAWFYSPASTEIKDSLRFVERLLATGQMKPFTRRRLQLALGEAQNWKDLDLKTRELHKSTVNNALRSLLSPEARDLFDESKARRFNPADVLSGKILVASLNSVSHPNLAALLFKALKRDFYESVLSRTAMKPAEDRLCGLILDELPLSVMSEDVEALALLRSKGGFVVACSQGINGLDEAIGQRQRRALMANFNSVFYFASREDQTDEHAMLTLGMHEDSERANDTHGHGNLQVEEPARPPNSRWICTPGSLARLPQHHAYAKLANGTVTKAPVWMEPGFHDFTAHPAVSKPDDLAEAIASLKSDDEDVPQTQPDVPLLLVHMHRQRHPLRLTPSVVAATWQLCKPRVRRSQLLPRLGRQIQGIEKLPSCWLLGLLQWIRKNPNLAPGVVRVSVRSGVLWPELDQAWTLWGDGPLTFPESINRFVYPSLWRELLPRHLVQLRVERPDLHAELDSLPQVNQQTGSF